VTRSAGDRELVEVACVRNQGEAEIIRGLLESAGIPCLVQPSGIASPQLGVAGLLANPLGLMVHAERAEDARALIAQAI
jgi:hypothetical protein